MIALIVLLLTSTVTAFRGISNGVVLSSRYQFCNGDIVDHPSTRNELSRLWSTKQNITTSVSTTPTKNKKSKRKAKYTPMVMYDENQGKQWQMSDSFNSTTLKLLFDFRDEVSGFFAKVEQQFSAWGRIVTSKVERDIRTTLGVSDLVTRQVSKNTKNIKETLQRPMKALPTTRGGSKDSQLLGGFGASTTKQRSKALKKRKLLPGGGRAALPSSSVGKNKKVDTALRADSLYRSVRLLPNKLQYDYQRRTTARDAAGIGPTASAEKIAKLLPGSSVGRSGAGLGGRLSGLLLPAEDKDTTTPGSDNGDEQEDGVVDTTTGRIVSSLVEGNSAIDVAASLDETDAVVEVVEMDDDGIIDMGTIASVVTTETESSVAAAAAAGNGVYNLEQALGKLGQYVLEDKLHACGKILRQAQGILLEENEQLKEWILEQEKKEEEGNEGEDTIDSSSTALEWTVRRSMRRELASLYSAIESADALHQIREQLMMNSADAGSGSDSVADGNNQLRIDKTSVESILEGLLSISYLRDQLLLLSSLDEEEEEEESYDEEENISKETGTETDKRQQTSFMCVDAADKLVELVSQQSAFFSRFYADLEPISIALMNEPAVTAVTTASTTTTTTTTTISATCEFEIEGLADAAGKEDGEMLDPFNDAEVVQSKTLVGEAITATTTTTMPTSATATIIIQVDVEEGNEEKEEKGSQVLESSTSIEEGGNLGESQALEMEFEAANEDGTQQAITDPVIEEEVVQLEVTTTDASSSSNAAIENITTTTIATATNTSTSASSSSSSSGGSGSSSSGGSGGSSSSGSWSPASLLQPAAAVKTTPIPFTTTSTTTGTGSSSSTTTTTTTTTTGTADQQPVTTNGASESPSAVSRTTNTLDTTTTTTTSAVAPTASATAGETFTEPSSSTSTSSNYKGGAEVLVIDVSIVQTYISQQQLLQQEQEEEEEMYHYQQAGDGIPTAAAGGGEGDPDVMYVETTAESTEATEAKVIKFILTAVDVVFFLTETLIKSVRPIVETGGSLALERVQSTYYINDFAQAAQYGKLRSILRPSSSSLWVKSLKIEDFNTVTEIGRQESDKWEIFVQFKYAQSNQPQQK